MTISYTQQILVVLKYLYAPTNVIGLTYHLMNSESDAVKFVEWCNNQLPDTWLYEIDSVKNNPTNEEVKSVNATDSRRYGTGQIQNFSW